MVCRSERKLRRSLRRQQGRDENASAGIVDWQSVKTSEEGAAERGFDAGKKINGRKRDILVDTLGLLLAVKVHAADIQDRDGCKLLFESCRDSLPRLFLIWADGGYRGKLIEWVAVTCWWVLEIVKRSDDAPVSKYCRAGGSLNGLWRGSRIIVGCPKTTKEIVKHQKRGFIWRW